MPAALTYGVGVHGAPPSLAHAMRRALWGRMVRTWEAGLGMDINVSPGVRHSRSSGLGVVRSHVSVGPSLLGCYAP
eukprot:9474547-Pyramimonas_sp.AAC.1